MDKDKFKELISSVALIKDLGTEIDDLGRLKKPKIQDFEFDEEGEPIEQEELFSEGNPTLGFRLVKIHPVPKLCELGCGKIVEDQKISHKVHSVPKKHWRTSCNKCMKVVGPDGKMYIAPEAARLYGLHFRLVDK